MSSCKPSFLSFSHSFSEFHLFAKPKKKKKKKSMSQIRHCLCHLGFSLVWEVGTDRINTLEKYKIQI